jgi:hypothetical protein
VLTLRQSAIGNAMQARGTLDNCGVTATIVERSGTRSLWVHTTATCVVPVTGLASTLYGSVEIYGGEPTTSIPITRGQTKYISLGGTVGAGD